MFGNSGGFGLNVSFVNKKSQRVYKVEVYKRGTFSAKMVYKRVRGSTSEQSLPV